MSSSSLFTSNVCVALIAAGIVVVAVACSGASSSTPDPGGEVDTSSTIPAGANRPSTGSSPSSSSSSSSDSGSNATSDASSSDAAAEASIPKDASTTDAKVDGGPAKLPYGSACTTHDQCAGGLCLEFDDKLRCTKTCKSDDDCQNGDDCDGDVKVCEID